MQRSVALEILEAARRDAVIDIADADIGADAADPGIFAPVDADALGIELGLADQAEVEMVDPAAVLRRVEIEMLHGGEAAGTRHVHHDGVGIARNMPADMARQEPRIGIEAAARRIADQDGRPLAAIKTLPPCRR